MPSRQGTDTMILKKGMDSVHGWTVHIIIEQTDVLLSRDPHTWFYMVMDKAAKEMGIPPFCPCMERPHRVHCPLGFDNYFQPMLGAGGDRA